MNAKRFLSAVALTACVFSSTQLQADEADPSSARPSKEDIIKHFDADGDGKLNREERLAAREAAKDFRQKRDEMHDRALERFDANQDGKLDDAERAQADAAFRERAASDPRMLAGVDTDGDGKISDTEWTAAREKLRDRKPSSFGKPKKEAP